MHTILQLIAAEQTSLKWRVYITEMKNDGHDILLFQVHERCGHVEFGMHLGRNSARPAALPRYLYAQSIGEDHGVDSATFRRR